MQRFSVIDHYIVSLDLFDTSICSLEELHEIDNYSDHDPLVVTLHMAWPEMARGNNSRLFCSKPALYKARDEHIASYRDHLRSSLHDITVPTDALHCTDLFCNNRLHADLLNSYAQDVVQSCLSSAEANILMTTRNAGTKSIAAGVNMLHH